MDENWPILQPSPTRRSTFSSILSSPPRLSSSPQPLQPPPPPPPPPSPDISPTTFMHDNDLTALTPATRNIANSDPSSPHVPTPTQKSRSPYHLPRLELSLILENQGSVARDHLASERTFLAYVRTSLAIASTGVALVQLFTLSTTTSNAASKRIQAYARPLGATTIVVGLCVLIIGIGRYFTIQGALVKGSYPVARTTMAAIAFSLGALVIAVFAILVAGRR